MSEMPDPKRPKKRLIRDMTLSDWIELTIFVAVSVITVTAGVTWLSGSA